MKEELLKKIRGTNTTVSMLVKDLQKNRIIFSYGEEKRIVAASLIKVPILIATLCYLEEKCIKLDHKISLHKDDIVDYSMIGEERNPSYTLEELLKWMIITSDNTATNLLINFIGMEYINNWILDNGLLHTKLQRKMMHFEEINQGRDNFTSLQDMKELFEGLYKGTIASSLVCEQSLKILKQQRDTTMLKRYIVDDVEIAHKTGELYRLNHDMGIVFSDNIDYFIGISVTDVYSNEEAYQIIGSLSKYVYKKLVKEGVVL